MWIDDTMKEDQKNFNRLLDRVRGAETLLRKVLIITDRLEVKEGPWLPNDLREKISDFCRKED